MLPDGNKPCVLLYVYIQPGDEPKIREVKAGMEEEGIPCRLVRSEEANAITLAYQGASASKLGVGVGIGKEALAIHYKKLPLAEPLFYLPTQSTLQDCRHFGYNAARLVKGIPFKNQSQVLVETKGGNLPLQDPNALYDLVQSIVAKILEEAKRGNGEVERWPTSH